MTVDRFAAAREQFSTGLAHLQSGRLAPAEQAFRASLSLLPGRPSTLTNLAFTLLKLGRPAEALPLLDEVLAQSPQDTEALGHRGVALTELRRPAEACAAFEALVQRVPERPEAWFHLAQTRQMLDQPAAALDAYDRCVALRPNHGITWSQRGSALRELGRADEAAASFERDGSMRLYFGQDSSQMMKTDRLLTVTIAAPQGKGKRTLTLAKDKVSLMLQNLTTLERTMATADGTLALEGRDLLTGSFALKATLGNRPLTLEGKFEKAPVVTALD